MSRYADIVVGPNVPASSSTRSVLYTVGTAWYEHFVFRVFSVQRCVCAISGLRDDVDSPVPNWSRWVLGFKLLPTAHADNISYGADSAVVMRLYFLV